MGASLQEGVIPAGTLVELWPFRNMVNIGGRSGGMVWNKNIFFVILDFLIVSMGGQAHVDAV